MSQPIVLEFQRDQDFVIESTDGWLVVTGTNVDINASIIAGMGQRNLYVRGFNVSISASINQPERDIRIFCHTLTLKRNITIDVSGKKGPGWPNAKASPKPLGSNGATGDPGRAGTNAGKILISAEQVVGNALSLIANGGEGGKGQTGGVGRQGKTGPAGKNGIKFTLDRDQGEKGGRGLQGGSAGQGGSGGQGGNGGTILLNVAKWSLSTPLKTGTKSPFTVCLSGLPG